MGTQQFCLKWNNHQLNMLSVFDHLLQNEAFVDVTLACEGSSLKAHKMVLSACSPYFQNLFMENPCQHPIVILKDIQYNDMKSIIDFMYKGEVNVSQEQLSALLKTADTLKVKGLAEVSGQVTQSPVPDASVQQQQQQPTQQQPPQQQQIPVPSKSPTPKRKRRHGAPASPSAINTSQSNSSSSSSTPQPLIQSSVSLSASSSSTLPKASTHSDDTPATELRHASKLKKTDGSNFDSVNELVVAHLKEERIEDESNDVEDLILESSQEHLEIDTDPSIMPFSNDGMDQENLSPMRNDNYPHTVSIPSTSQTGSSADTRFKAQAGYKSDLTASEDSNFLECRFPSEKWLPTSSLSLTPVGHARNEPSPSRTVRDEISVRLGPDPRMNLLHFMSFQQLLMIENSLTSSRMISKLMDVLFTKNELSSSSVTGRKSSRSVEVKKALDPVRTQLILDFVVNKYEEETYTTIRQKMAQKCKTECYIRKNVSGS